MAKLHTIPARPRSSSPKPGYPAVLAIGLAIGLAACGGSVDPVDATGQAGSGGATTNGGMPGPFDAGDAGGKGGSGGSGGAVQPDAGPGGVAPIGYDSGLPDSDAPDAKQDTTPSYPDGGPSGAAPIEFDAAPDGPAADGDTDAGLSGGVANPFDSGPNQPDSEPSPGGDQAESFQ